MKLINFVIILFFPLISWAAPADTFESKTVGFSLTKPNDWQFVTAEQNLENLKKVELNDADFHKLMIKYSQAPLVAIMKHQEPFDDLNPSLKVSIKPLRNFDANSPKKILNMFLPQFQKTFNDFKLVQEPKSTIVSGLNAAYMRINYSLAIPDGRTFPTTSELWVVPRGNYFFMIGAGTRQDETTGRRSEIKSIMDSIIIKK